MVVSSSLALAACTDATAVTTSPVTRFVSPASADALVTGASRASGHVTLHGTTVQNIVDETISFTALGSGDGNLGKGQVEVHALRFTGEELVVHADVTCVSVVGANAFIGSRVTRFVLDGEEQPIEGAPMVFQVRDGGEGDDAIDQASLVFFGVPVGGDLTYCATHPAIPILRPSDNGNVQVKSD
jgi:hypothetical protein